MATQVASPLALIMEYNYVKLIHIFKMLGDMPHQQIGLEPATWCLLGGCSTNWVTEAGVQGSQPGLD